MNLSLFTHTHTHTDPVSNGTRSTIAEEVEQNCHSCSLPPTPMHTLAQLLSAAFCKQLILTTKQIRALMCRGCKCTIQCQSEFPWDSFHGFKVDGNKRANPITASESVSEAVCPCRVCNEFRGWVGLSAPSRGLQGAPSLHYSNAASLCSRTDETTAPTTQYIHKYTCTHTFSQLWVNTYPVMKNACTQTRAYHHGAQLSHFYVVHYITVLKTSFNPFIYLKYTHLREKISLKCAIHRRKGVKVKWFLSLTSVIEFLVLNENTGIHITHAGRTSAELRHAWT